MKAIILAASMTISALAHGNTIVAIANDKTPVPINSGLGTIIQFPRAVKTVTPSRHYVITDVGADPLQKVDIKTFQVKAKGPVPMEEVVFILADSTPITLQFLPQSDAAKYYNITLDTSAKDATKSKFLTNELSMMRAMLKDEPGGFDRKVVDKEINASLKDLSLKLKRIYSSPQFTGYVFLLKNSSSQQQKVSPSLFNFDTPNRALLAQLDKEELSPCPVLSSSPECQMALRIIVKGPVTDSFGLGQLPDKAPPFVNAKTSEGGVQ